MFLKIAINGFGRIGRLILRALAESNNPEIKIVAINEPSVVSANKINELSYLLRYDSVHGQFPKCDVEGECLIIEGEKIHLLNQKDPENLPWKELEVDLVLECSGKFTTHEGASKHITAGAKRVLISAPSPDADISVVYGVNHEQLQKHHRIISNASCTTNCLAPLLYVAHEGVGIERGFMTTVHAYTADQNLVDGYHKDPYRSRAALCSAIPTSTGAAKTIGKIIPDLDGKIDGAAIRVPLPNVSLIDLTFVSQNPTTAEEINNLFREATQLPCLIGVLDYVNAPLVSVDFNHNSHSAIFDASQTRVVDNKFCRILAWYDNEWGFANRMLDVATYLRLI